MYPANLKFLVYPLGLLLLRLLAWPLRSARARQVLFLIASYLFYASWGRWFLAVLVLSSLMNYALGAYLRRRPTAGRLWAGVVLNLLLLGIFKYLPPLARMASQDSTLAAKLAYLVMPIGISFWTFQALSYLFDLYREEHLDPSLLEFCLYMAFWPTVLSGPICRLPNMLPQFRQEWSPSWDDIGSGTQRVCIGVLMMGLAQLLGDGLRPGQGVNWGFDQTAARWGGIDVWCLAIGFGFQLFFDFAGYSHIVIGTAQLFGIRLQENFERPHLSTTPSVFWTRWHMSLSFWIRDYVFLPLATLRREAWWRSLALLLSMVLFGLWHRATLLFILWGTYHGVLLLLHRQWQQVQRRLEISWPAYAIIPLSWGFTFAAVSLGWIFFRARELKQASAMLAAAFSPGSYHRLALPANLYLLISLAVAGYFAVVGIASLLDREAFAQQPAVRLGRTQPAPRLTGRVLEVLSRDRWVWVAPLICVAAFYAFVILRPQETTATPFLYRLF